YTFRLDQIWNMFAPKPLTDDGWYVIPAWLQNGTEVDLMTGTGPVHWEKPTLVYVTYRNQRWRKYLMNIWKSDSASHRPYFGRYLCRSWNAVHQGEEMLQNLEIYFMKEETLPGGKVAPPEKVL